MSTFEGVFFMFSGAKTNVIIFLKNIVDNEVKKNIFFLKRLRFFEIYIYIEAKKHFQLCLAPIETHHSGIYL